MKSFCRACRECRVHCIDTKTFPELPRNTLVHFMSVLNCLVRHNKLWQTFKKCVYAVWRASPTALARQLDRLGSH